MNYNSMIKEKETVMNHQGEKVRHRFRWQPSSCGCGHTPSLIGGSLRAHGPDDRGILSLLVWRPFCLP